MKLGRRKLLWLLIAISLESSLQSSQSQTKLIATKNETKFDEKVLNVTTLMEPTGRNDFSFDFHCDLFVEMETFLVQVGIALPSANGSYDTFIANSVSDLCKYFENNDSNIFLKLFFAGRFARKSFPKSCPIKQGQYFMKGFKFNETALKVRAVETKFMVSVDLCTMGRDKLKCAVNMKFYGEIRDRKRWEKEVAERSVNKTV